MDKLKRRMAIAAMMVFAVAFTVISVAAMETPLPADAADKPYTAATPEAEETAYIVQQLVLTEPAPEAQAINEVTVETEQPEPEEEQRWYTYYDVPLSDELQEYTQDLCEEYDFPHYGIIIALIAHESSFRETVVSATNDYGYMQINKCNHEWLREELGITDFTDGKQNIRCGIYILAKLYHKYEDIGLALMAYNCGESGAAKLWEQGIYSTAYSREIQQAAAELPIRASE